MPQLSYPGVYIEEVPSGVRTITAVSTSTAAFVDFFREGPMDKAILIQGMTDFARIFGGLDRRSPASYAIAQFFLNGGQECYVVRVTNGATPAAVATGSVQDEGLGATILTFLASNAGAWGGNLRVDIDQETDDPNAAFNVYVRRYADDGETVLVEESFLKVSVEVTNARYVKTIINDESVLVTVDHTPTGTSPEPLPAATGTKGATLAALTQAQLNTLAGGKFDVTIGAVTKTATLDSWTAGAVTTLSQLRARVERALRNADSLDPAFAGASADLIGGQLVVRSGKRASTYGPAQTTAIANAGADPSATTLGFDASTVLANVQEYPLDTGATIAAWVPGTKGDDGDLPDAGDIIGSQAIDPPTGMFALDKADLFNILCLPAAADLADSSMIAVVSNALKYCADRRAFMIIDIPETINTIQEMKDWLDAHADFREKNAAIYFPRMNIPDPLDGFRSKNVAASGPIAGVYARTDAERGVWKAPAGIEAGLEGVTELAFKMTDKQNGTLNVLGINCLRVFPVNGKVVWGARTLAGADAIGSVWKYVSTRRLALNLEESLFRGTKWVVFEPNDEPLWANIRLNINAFMNSLFRQGAFQGTDPKQAYFVKVDAETTTQDDRNKGIVNIDVGFAPLNTAEFVVLRIQQMKGDL
jgi:phage tail sheath protein FI